MSHPYALLNVLVVSKSTNEFKIIHNIHNYPLKALLFIVGLNMFIQSVLVEVCNQQTSQRVEICSRRVKGQCQSDLSASFTFVLTQTHKRKQMLSVSWSIKSKTWIKFGQSSTIYDFFHIHVSNDDISNWHTVAFYLLHHIKNRI